MSKNISYKVRMGMQVAFAVAEEVANNLGNDKLFGTENRRNIRPVLLSMPTSLNFRFEGRISVQVNLYDARKESEKERQQWWVKSARAHYYMGNLFAEQVWGAYELTELKEHRPWRDPQIFTSKMTRFKVGAFHNPHATGTEPYFIGVEAYPYDRFGECYQLICEVPYDPSVPGDRDRAAQEAQGIYVN